MKRILFVQCVLLAGLLAAQTKTGKTFASAKEAADALVKAAEAADLAAIEELFGPDGKDLVTTADPVADKNRVSAFAALAKEKMSVVVDPKNRSRAMVSVGSSDWPLPVPIVNRQGKWYFDAEAGREEILARRIGANELDAIQICRGYVEAQKDYAAEVRDDSGVNQYAQKIISSPGKKDGLYWTNSDGKPGGPISEPIAKAIEEGYSPSARSGYHGYYFKVLKAQGPSAPLGELDYVINGLMIGGFALIATPAEYGVTGIKTFIVSHNGIVYEKDLGPNSLELAKKIDRYNPDKTWKRTEDEWPNGSN
jgi:hypothetical protein